MLKLTVNEIDVYVTTQEFAQNGGMEYSDLVGQLKLVWLWPNYRPWESILKATGHDTTKIDYAVPQPWLDEQYQRWGDGDWRTRAFWTYETKGFGGEPLYQRDVVNEFTRLLLEELACGLADGWLELKEADSVKL